MIFLTTKPPAEKVHISLIIKRCPPLIADTPDAYCSPYPASHRIPLPIGCKTQGGALAYDVGMCPDAPCRHSSENESMSCQDEQHYCCGPTNFTTVDLVCDEGSDFIFVVRRCILYLMFNKACQDNF